LADPVLAARLAKKVPAARRVAVLRAAAAERIAEGTQGEAAAMLERAAELAGAAAPLRADVERELRSAYEAAGRGTETAARAQREAASDEATPELRAERWSEIADRREARGDLPGTMRALLEAARLDPVPVERWSAIERIAELVGDHDARVAALQAI